MAKAKKNAEEVKPINLVEVFNESVDNTIENTPLGPMFNGKFPEVGNDQFDSGTENVALEEVKPGVPTLPVVELTTMEDKIVNFLEGKNDYVKMNDFLKSLYPIPSYNVPATWMQQAVSKTLRGLLESMVKEGLIRIANNTHLMLGKHYYAGVDAKQNHYNLTNVEIYGKL